jgi:hypothetical protein
MGKISVLEEKLFWKGKTGVNSVFQVLSAHFAIDFDVYQIRHKNDQLIDLNNPSLYEPIEKIDELGKSIAKLFKRK